VLNRLLLGLVLAFKRNAPKSIQTAIQENRPSSRIIKTRPTSRFILICIEIESQLGGVGWI